MLLLPNNSNPHPPTLEHLNQPLLGVWQKSPQKGRLQGLLNDSGIVLVLCKDFLSLHSVLLAAFCHIHGIHLISVIVNRGSDE